MRNIISPNKTFSVPKEGGGAYVGIVKSTSGGIYVEIPRVAPEQAFGPCSVSGMFSLSLTYGTAATPTGGTIQVVTGVTLNQGGTQPQVGDKVMCTFLDNQLNEVAIVGIVD